MGMVGTSAAARGMLMIAGLTAVGGAALTLLRNDTAIVAPETEAVAPLTSKDATATGAAVAFVESDGPTPDAVPAPTADAGDSAPAAVSAATAAAPMPATQDGKVPNRLSLSVDELVNAGLASDLAEDLVDALNGFAIDMEQPPLRNWGLRHATPRILLAMGPLLVPAIRDGSVVVVRADECFRVSQGQHGTIGHRDGITYLLHGHRGCLLMAVRDRAVPPEAWQFYLAENPTAAGATPIDRDLAEVSSRPR